jgi:ATP-dependent Clp protease protease subunit
MADVAGGTLPLPIDRSLHFNKHVDQESIGELTKKIIEINESDRYLKKLYKLNGLKYKAKPIKITIDSYGGSVYACLGLLAIMDKSKTPIHTIATGCAMSAAFDILACGHKRFAYEHTTMMYHQVSSGMWGKLKDIEEDVEETKRLQKVLDEIVLKKTKISEAQLKDNYEKKKDWFMTSKEALELGVIDCIL